MRKVNLSPKTKKLISISIMAILLITLFAVFTYTCVEEAKNIKTLKSEVVSLSSSYAFSTSECLTEQPVTLPLYENSSKANSWSKFRTHLKLESTEKIGIMIQLYHQSCFIIIDNKIVGYSDRTINLKNSPILYDYKDYLFGKNENSYTPQKQIGLEYFFFPIESEHNNKQIEIVFYSPYNSYASKFQEIKLSSYKSILNELTLKNIIPTCLLFFFATVSVLLIIAIIVCRKQKELIQKLIPYCFCFILTTGWLTASNPVLHCLYDSGHLFFKLEVLLYLLTIQFVVYLINIAVYKKKSPLISIPLYVGLLLTIIIFSLDLEKVIDLVAQNYLINCLIVSTFVYSCILLAFKIRKKHKYAITFIIVNVLSVIIETIQTAILYAPVHLIINLAPINIILLSIPLIYAFKEFNKNFYALQKENASLEIVAHVDSLTKINNRACFNKDLSEIKKYNNKNNIYIGIFDLNNLKETNDRLGHRQGDLVIKTAARLINLTFSQIANCYRIGGDEFAIIANSPIPQVIEELKQKFEKNVRENNLSLSSPQVSIAYSVKKYDSLIDNDLDELFVRVDKDMYAEKQKYKSANNFATSNN